MSRRPNLGLSVSWTTRPPRPGERDGVHYHFVDETQFRDEIDADGFVEWEEYRGALYGTPWREVHLGMDSGHDVLLEIDVRGARSVKKLFPEAITVFLYPPSMDVLESRLRKRGTDTEQKVLARLEAAREEMTHKGEFDHPIENSEVQAAADQLTAILDD